ncbi:MAG: glutamate 5-kinase, partial [Candidatus Ornithospirochaeta sp.]
SYNLLCSQVLITRSSLNNRTSYNNLRESVATLLDLGVVPIFNENDVVSTAEIGDVFGDNDRMSAYCASKMDAELLILLTDIDGVYTGNPKKDKDAKMVKEIRELTPEVFSYAKGAGSTFSTGGMKTKLQAAEIAQKGGCGTIIASGYEEDAILRILNGEELGTYILPTERLKQRERWILNTPSLGYIVIDDGAVKAILKDHKSLLPKGILGVEGFFLKGDVIDVKNEDGDIVAKAITNYQYGEIAFAMGKDSKEIPDVIGGGHKVVFRPEDMVAYEQL